MEKLEKDVAIQKTTDAIRFMTKLYTEISLLVRAIEALMHDKKFVRGQIGGGADNVGGDRMDSLTLSDRWLYKKISVFFVEDHLTRVKEEKKKESTSGETESGGEKQSKRTSTTFQKDLKIIFIRFVLDGEEPVIYYSVLYQIKEKKSKYKTFEDVVSTLDNNSLNIDFLATEGPHTIFQAMNFKNKTGKVNLYEINSAEELKEKLVNPLCKSYEGIHRHADDTWRT